MISRFVAAGRTVLTLGRSLADGCMWLLAPRVCRICGCSLTGEEEFVCLDCLSALPRTEFYRYGGHPAENRLLAYAPRSCVAPWCRYGADTVMSPLIHDFKYHDFPGLCRALGREYGRDLKSGKVLEDVDVLVPMPLHWQRRLWRGYNQSLLIARGISDVTGIPVVNALVARTRHRTQTRLSMEERFRNVNSEALDVRKSSVDALQARHIALVDDIVTTGATAEAMTRTLKHKLGNIPSVTVLALGATAK